MNPRDKNMAIAAMLMQAGANVQNANQPRRGQRTPGLGGLFSSGVSGAAEGMGNSMLGIRQLQEAEQQRKIQELKMNSEMARQAKEAQGAQNAEAMHASLSEEEQRIARAFGDPSRYLEFKRRQEQDALENAFRQDQRKILRAKQANGATGRSMAFDIQGALAEGYSPQEINSFLAKDRGFNLQGALDEGYSHDEILSHLAAGQPAQPAAPQPEPAARQQAEPAGSEVFTADISQMLHGGPGGGPQGAMSPGTKDAWMRVPGRTLRAGTSGVAGVADLLYSPFRYLINKGNEALGGAPEYFKPISQTMERAYDQAGISKAANDRERLGDKAAEALAGAAPPIGAARYALRGASLLPSAGRGMLGMLAEAPGMQAASSATGGASSELARQSGASPELQMAAGLVGGALPPVGGIAGQTLGRGASGLRTAVDAFTPAGRERIAGQTLNRVASDPNAARAALARGAEEYVPGSIPTTAQATGDAGLAVLEKGLASSGPRGSAIGERLLAQEEARQAAANTALDSRAPYGGTMEAGDVGARIRGAYDANYQAARARTGEAYAAIDPEGAATFNLEPLAQSFEQSIGGGRYQTVPPQVSGIMSKIRSDIQKGEVVGYRDLQDMRTTLTDMAESAGRTGDAATARIAGGMKRDLDKYLESAARDVTAQENAVRGAALREARELTKDMAAQGYSPAAVEKITNQLAGDIARQRGVASPVTLSGERTGIIGRVGEELAGKMGHKGSGNINLSQAALDAIDHKHGGQFRQLGFKDARDFVEHVFGKLDGVYPARAGTYDFISKRTSPFGKATLESRLEAPHGGFETTTALPSRIDAYKNKNPLWERAQTSHFVASNETPSAVTGQSGFTTTINQPAASGNIYQQGFSPEQAARFRAAKQARVEQGERFERGANQLMSRRGNTLEGGAIPASRVPENYFRAGEQGGEAMRAFNLAAGTNPEARAAMQDYIISQARNKATTKTGALDIDRLKNWANSHRPALREMGLENLADMPKIRADLQRARDITRRAAVQGSPTAQNLATQKLVTQTIADRIFGASEQPVSQGGFMSALTAIPRFALEKSGRFLFEPANEAIRDILINASLDPKLAARLMRSGQYTPRESLAGILGRNARAYANTATRQGLLSLLAGQQ